MVSPVIDLKRMTFLAIANRINQIDSSADVYPTTIFDPPTDPEGDDHDAIYLTKKVALDKIPRHLLELSLMRIERASLTLKFFSKF